MKVTSLRRGLVTAAAFVLGCSALVALPADALAATPPTAGITKVSPNTGKTAGGIKVTVTGTDFSHVSKVLFGTTAGTHVKVLSSHKLTVTDPKHSAGAVHVRVVTAIGSKTRTSHLRTADHFAYFAPPAVTAVSPAAGVATGGTTVTVTGSGFTRITRVAFGTTTARSLHVVSAGKLTVTVPAHTAGLADVRVYGSYGTSPVTARDRYSYGVTVTAVTAKSGPLAGGGTVTVAGTGLTGASAVLFGSVMATNVHVVSATALTVTAPPHLSGSIDVRVVASLGTSAATTKDHYTYGPTVTQVSDAGAFEALDVSCPSTSLCVAVGTGASGALWSKYTGTWTAPAAIAGLVVLDSISCPSTTDCIAIGISASGSTSATRFNGTSWTAATAIAGFGTTGEVSALACGSSTFCLAVGIDQNFNALAAKFNGTSWSVAARPSIVPEGLSCSPGTKCVALGLDPTTFTARSATFNGTSWSTSSVVPLESDTLSCVSVSYCLALGNNSSTNAPEWSTWNASSWAVPQSLPSALDNPTDVTCVTATWCMAIGIDDVAGSDSSIFNGSVWSTPQSVQAFGPASGGGEISCASATLCVGALGGGAVVDYTGTWDDTAQFAGFPTGVSCTSPTACFAIDEFGSGQTWDGLTWTPVAAQAGLGDLNGVSCVSATDCVAVGTSSTGPAGVVWNGTSWSAPSAITGMSYVASVSCTSATNCLAVGGSSTLVKQADPGVASTFNGSTWSAPSTITDLDSPETVSCASVTLCVATGGIGDEDPAPVGDIPAVLDGTTWTSYDSLSSEEMLSASCAPGATTCLAVDFETGQTDVYTSGTGWAIKNGPSTPDTTVAGVSCVAATTCIGVGDDGTPQAWVYTGTWSDAIAVKTVLGNSLGEVSCSDATFCAATAAFDEEDDDSGSLLASAVRPAVASAQGRALGIAPVTPRWVR